MQSNFQPNQVDTEASSGRSRVQAHDSIESVLKLVARSVLIGVFGLLPILFVPSVVAPFDYSKALFVVGAVLIATIFFSLSVLRSGSVSIATTWSLAALWGVVAVSAVSALLSGDVYDSLIGDSARVHTTFFVALMAAVVTLVAIMGQQTLFVMRTYILLTASALLLGVFHVLRILGSSDWLSLGIFTSPTGTFLGSWNDLGLFFGLSILLSLVALEQLPLTKWGRALFSAVSGLALMMLMVVNFFPVWIVLGLVSLIMLMYVLTKDRFYEDASVSSPISLTSVIVSVLVFVVSLSFIIGGTALGESVSRVTGVSYTEVRPSLTATTDIARQVYSENAFLGTGPNRFADAWRQYKDPSLNGTIFWATNFSSGSGYLTTQFVTNGILGIVAWLTFLGLFMWTGFRTLFGPRDADRFWYFIATSSFVAAAYLWLMLFTYNPAATVLLLTALFTGVFLTASVKIRGRQPFTLSIATNRRAGFMLVGVVMVIIVASASSLFFVGQHYAAAFSFTDAVANRDQASLEAVEQRIAASFDVVESDLFARQIAQYQLQKMNVLIGLNEPTPEQQQAFQAAAANGVASGRTATQLDPTEPLNWLVLARIYTVLASAGVEGAGEEAATAIERAQSFDPTNPVYPLLQAQLLTQTGTAEEVRAAVAESIRLKPNYTDALFFLAQLEVSEGNVEQAIAATRSIVSLEPNNPARYYQLGVLYSANQDVTSAIQSFERAVALDPNYANARYLLALGYVEQDRLDDAVAQLSLVRELNPDNEVVATLITQIQNGEIAPSITDVTPETELESAEAVSENDDDSVTTTEEPDTSLIVPLNPVTGEGESDEESEAASNDTSDAADETSQDTDNTVE